MNIKFDCSFGLAVVLVGEVKINVANRGKKPRKKNTAYKSIFFWKN